MARSGPTATKAACQCSSNERVELESREVFLVSVYKTSSAINLHVLLLEDGRAACLGMTVVVYANNHFQSCRCVGTESATQAREQRRGNRRCHCHGRSRWERKARQHASPSCLGANTSRMSSRRPLTAPALDGQTWHVGRLRTCSPQPRRHTAPRELHNNATCR